MPSTYAHYRMGQQVRSMLDGNEKKIVEKYPQLYLIGLWPAPPKGPRPGLSPPP